MITNYRHTMIDIQITILKYFMRANGTYKRIERKTYNMCIYRRISDSLELQKTRKNTWNVHTWTVPIWTSY